jgi:Ca2+-binding RTX toxin-like protein
MKSAWKSDMPVKTAVRASDLLDTFGVATHINFTDGVYAPIAKVLGALDYLGIDHVRDRAPNPSYARVGQLHLEQAADAGLKFTFHALAKEDPVTVVRNLHSFLAANPGTISAIEGPNEVNNFPVSYKGLTGTAAAQAYQKALFAAVNADPLLKDIPVLGFTDYPVHSSASDWNNTHPYPKKGDQPRDTILLNRNAQDAVDPGKPFAITEMGYHNALNADTKGGWEGVDLKTQAKLVLNAYMDAADLGSRATYLYQLLNSPATGSGADQENQFGLFTATYAPKPAATAIHNLTTILHDDATAAGSFQTGRLDYTVTGLPAAGGHSYLTQKADGSLQIVVWAEPDIWDEAADKAISAPASRTTVDLRQVFGTVQVFDPLLGTKPIQTLHDVSTVNLTVVDHPLIVHLIDPAGTPTGASTVRTAASSYTLASHEDDLVYTGSGSINGKGNAGDNVLKGGNGNDLLNGKGGADTLHGGAGNDLYVVDNAGDRVVELSHGGRDTVNASVSFKLSGNVENLTLTGTAPISGTGQDLDNKIVGNAAANILNGGGGNDVLIGGLGRDVLTGGAGADIFTLKSLADSGVGSAGRDQITDFTVGVDRIDLSALQGSAKQTELTFIGARGFTGRAGEIHAVRSTDSTLVEGDMDGNGRADFQILLTGVAGGLHASDFLL